MRIAAQEKRTAHGGRKPKARPRTKPTAVGHGGNLQDLDLGLRQAAAPAFSGKVARSRGLDVLAPASVARGPTAA
jgi:hypothetical protein